MNHKRKRPKNRRAGCLMCKPWKICGNHNNRGEPRMQFGNLRRYQSGTEQIRCEAC
jgi:hypothetical protein